MAFDPKSKEAKKGAGQCCPDEDAQLTSADDSCPEDDICLEDEEDEDSGCPTCLI